MAENVSYETFLRNMRKVLERHGLRGEAADARMKELLESDRFRRVIEILRGGVTSTKER